jgi:glycosyltransferase involved in cell wall biosynthesis
MRIIFFIDTMVSGGKQRRLTELMRALKSMQDIEFELVVMSKDIHYKEIFDLGINIHYIIRKTKKDISVLPRFYKLCRSYKPDIIHCWDSMTAVYLVLICKLLHIKLVNGMVVSAPDPQYVLDQIWWRAKLTFPFSDIVLGNSKAGLLAYKAPKSKSVVIYNGFNFDRTENLISKEIIRKQIKTDSSYLIGMVATFVDYKDFKTYYRAAKILLDRRKDITFLAIGADTDSAESRDIIGEQYIEHFRLLGEISGVESFVNAMDICVLSTFTEGISNSILEYMALGKPVVATSGGGTNEIVKDNETGFLIKPSDPEELAWKLEILLNDADLRTKMGLAGKECIKKEFSIDQMVRKCIDTYKSLLKD